MVSRQRSISIYEFSSRGPTLIISEGDTMKTTNTNNNKNIASAFVSSVNTWGKVAVAGITEVASLASVATDYAIDNVDYIADINSHGYKYASNYGRAKAKNVQRINSAKDLFNGKVEAAPAV